MQSSRFMGVRLSVVGLRFDKDVSRLGSMSVSASVPRAPDGDGGTPEGDVFAAGTATSTCSACLSSLVGNQVQGQQLD